MARKAEPGEIWIRGDNLFAGYWPDGRGGQAGSSAGSRLETSATCSTGSCSSSTGPVS